MLNQHYFTTMGPLIIVTITAFVVMVLEFLFKSGNRRWLSLLAIVGVAIALVDMIWHYNTKPVLTLNTMVIDPMGTVFSIILLATTILILLFTFDYAGRVKVAAEHTYLILFAVAGALAMATAIDLITLYIGLELLSVSSYVLVAVRRQNIKSVEGGVKYLLIGSIGSAILLYGISFIYGINGSTNVLQLGLSASDSWSTYPTIVTVSFLLILIGMGVKLSVVPFHMWTPDAYEGAASPISSLLATLSKTASFAMLLRIMLFVYGSNATNLFFWVGILAALSMIVGNLIALPQRNMKRLLAFSSVAQVGYVLIPFTLFGHSDPSDWYGLMNSIMYYLFAYTFMTIGAFAVVHVVARAQNSIDSEALTGLYRRSPWLAVALTIFLLSLAGMPLTAGFIGKFYIFTDTVHLHTAWLGIILFGTSVISFFYYIGWIRKIYKNDTGLVPITEGVGAGVGPGRIPASGVMHTLLGLCVAGTLVFGIVPASWLHVLMTTKWF